MAKLLDKIFATLNRLVIKNKGEAAHWLLPQLEMANKHQSLLGNSLNLSPVTSFTMSTNL